MKNKLWMIIIVSSIIISCQSTQKSTSPENPTLLTGTWILKKATVTDHKFEELFSERIPQMTLSIPDSTVSGNSSCNNFNGKFEAADKKITFSQNMVMTRMFCEGDGEKVFMELLSKTDSYRMISENTLQLHSKESLLLEFDRK